MILDDGMEYPFVHPLEYNIVHISISKVGVHMHILEGSKFIDWVVVSAILGLSAMPC